VLVSAFTTRGLAADVFRTVLRDHELLVGEVVLRELRRVLLRKMHVPQKTVDNIEASLRARTVVAVPADAASVRVRDPDDALILASAEASGADILITGDHDLLVLADKARVKILNARGFWTLIREQSAD